MPRFSDFTQDTVVVGTDSIVGYRGSENIKMTAAQLAAFIKDLVVIGLFTNASGVTIPTGTDLVQTTGWSHAGIGVAHYTYDASIDAAYVAANPRTSFLSNDERGFALAEPFVDVHMVGAIGNGIIDDTVAINAAISTVAAHGGGEVYFPAGTYLISAPINGAAFVSMSGQSRSQTTIHCATNGVTMLSFANIYTYGIRVSGMTISGVYSSSGTIGCYVGATLEQSAHMAFRDVQFLNHAKGFANGGNYGLFDSQFDGCDFIQCNVWGLEVAGSGVSLVDCKFRICGWGVIHTYLNGNSIAGAGYVNCTWISNNFDVVLNGATQRSTNFEHCWFEQCSTATLGSLGGTHFLHGMTFKSCIFQPGSTGGFGVISLPALSLTGLLAFDSCTVFTSPYAAALIPNTSQMAPLVANQANFTYRRNNCISTNGTSGGTSPYDQWSTWTPSITSGSGALTTTGIGYARYNVIGKTVFFNVNIVITINGTGASNIQFTLPISPRAGIDATLAGRNLGTGNMIQGRANAATSSVSLWNYNNTYPAADGNVIEVSGFYEML